MDWDDIRYFLAVARKGSIRGSSTLLSVNHSTVSRRINSFEHKMGVRLFERLTSGYVLTIAGKEMLISAERIEDEVNKLNRKVIGRDTELSGQLRVTLPLPILSFITNDIVTFTKRYPNIDLELLISYDEFNLNNREADVALRATNAPPENLVGRKIVPSAKADYGLKSYLVDYKKTGDTTLLNWIGSKHFSDEQWIKDNYSPTITVQHQISDLMARLAAVKAGLGVTTLPCILCDDDPDLERVTTREPELAWDIWILTHKDLRDVTRIKIFMDFMTDAIRQHGDSLLGITR